MSSVRVGRIIAGVVVTLLLYTLTFLLATLLLGWIILYVPLLGTLLGWLGNLTTGSNLLILILAFVSGLFPAWICGKIHGTSDPSTSRAALWSAVAVMGVVFIVQIINGANILSCVEQLFAGVYLPQRLFLDA